MQTCGSIIRKRREKLGMTLDELAGFVLVSKATMSRTENDRRTLKEDEIRLIAEALGLESQPLIECYNTQKEAQEKAKTLLLPGGFFLEQADWMDQYINLAEDLRIGGAPELALGRLNMVIHQLQLFLDVSGPTQVDRSLLWRLLVKALVSRAACFTMMLACVQNPAVVEKQIRLEEIVELQFYLQPEDAHHLDLAIALPSMTSYLAGKNEQAGAWIQANLQYLSGPYVRGLMLRDQIVIAGKQQQRHLFQRSVKQASVMIDSGRLDKGGWARIQEGKVRALSYMGQLYNETDLQEARQSYWESEAVERRQPFIAAQIARTTIQYLVNCIPLDEERILAAAKESVHQFLTGRYYRQLRQVRRMLLATESKRLVEYADSLPG